MATTVSIAESSPYAIKTARVSCSPTAKSFSWTTIPYLHVDSLRRAAGPEIDQCQFSRITGDFAYRNDDPHGGSATSGATNTLSGLNRQYCKVEMLNAADEVTEKWYGIFEVDERNTSVVSSTGLRPGLQRLTAYGLARELELTTVRKTILSNYNDTDTFAINRGIPFNFVDRAGGYNLRGNYGGANYFSFQPYSGTKWNAITSIQYLFEHFSPEGVSGAEHIDWEIGGDVINWYDISTETDRRTVKEIIDELLNRRRLAGYWVEGYESGGDLKAKLWTFTFAESAITIGSDTIPANSNQIEITAGSAPVIRDRIVRKVQTQAADRILVEGAPITSTFSLDFDTGLAIGWESGDEEDYLNAAGAGEEDDNAIARQRDELEDVFSRFIVKDDWDGRELAGHKITIAVANISDSISDADMEAAFASSELASPLWFRGKRFREFIALKNQSTDEYRRPFVIFPSGLTGRDGQYVFADQASVGDRRFACTLRMLHDTLGIRLEVNRAGGQSLLAAGHWNDADATAGDLDPDAEANLAFDYEDMILTATLEWDDRCVAELIINASPVAHDRVKVIRVPDARLDFEIPGTITDIDQDGMVVASTGKVLVDDRARLRTIAAAAGQWYGAERNAIVLSYSSLTPFVQLGQLVTSLVDGLISDTVNTPVTGIAYDFTSGTTSIETSYADADFAGVG